MLTAGFDDNWVVDKHANTGSRATSYNDSGIISRDDIKPINITENPYAVNHSVPPRFDATLTNIGGITTSYYKYCDDNGEFDNIKMYFLNDLKISNVTLSSNDNVKDLFIDYFNMPMVSDSVSNEYLFGIDLNIKKDNKEKPIISTQFEFCKDDSSISFTKLLLERQEMIRSIRDTRGLYLRLYDENHTFINEIGAEYNLSVAIKNDYCAEVQYLGPLGDTKYVTIVDYDKNPILTFDITKNETSSLFLNIRRYL